jgi:membrane-bound lytic murein transglycosylase B
MPTLRFVIFSCTLLLTTTTTTATPSPSFAARCGGDFKTFIASISAEAASAGISQGVISHALSGVNEDMAVLNFDRRQRYTFSKSFEQYVSTRVAALPSGIE